MLRRRYQTDLGRARLKRSQAKRINGVAVFGAQRTHYSGKLANKHTGSPRDSEKIKTTTLTRFRFASLYPMDDWMGRPRHHRHHYHGRRRRRCRRRCCRSLLCAGTQEILNENNLISIIFFSFLFFYSPMLPTFPFMFSCSVHCVVLLLVLLLAGTAGS